MLVRGLPPEAALWTVIPSEATEPETGPGLATIHRIDPARNQAFAHKYGKAVGR